MIFNSLAFAVFIPIVFGIYWFALRKSLKWQNLFLVVASYFFYGWWDWRFLALIFFSSFSDYLISILIDRSENLTKRKLLVVVSIIINLGTLVYFKYSNFFIENFILLGNSLGLNLSSTTLNIILPVGISFYTFQSMSYTIDVYRKELKACKDLSIFLAYISFFPQLVAGPIERAKHLLPQFQKKRNFNYEDGSEGAKRILWGFFKKVVIADNCAVFTDQIFANPESFSGSTLVIGIVLFAYQLYCDFSGYSDIAIGTARLFGFHIRENFEYPFFAKSLSEFWRKWHISLSSWLRDYLYTPLVLKFRNLELYGIVIALIISFVIIGFWHGANWTFIVFGLIYGVIISIETVTKKKRKKLRKKIPEKLFNVGARIFTFSFFLATLIFFRSPSMSEAISYFKGIFSASIISVPSILAPKFRMIYLFLLIPLFMWFEWRKRNDLHVLEFKNISPLRRWVSYSLILVLIVFFSRFNQNDFIYFQF